MTSSAMNPGSASGPLVTVVVPVYNGAAYLRESLDSILAQTYRPVEILVMDDESTDETPEIVASYSDRVYYHRNPTNLGQFNNVNAGIGRARGELVAVYHADDIYFPEVVAREVACFQRWPEVGAVFGLPILVDAAGSEYGRLILPPEIRGSRPLDFPTVFNGVLRHQNVFLPCPAAMVRASTYRRVGLYRQDPWRDSADLEMWIRIAREFPIVVLDEYVMKYRHVPTQAHRRYNRLRTTPALHFEMMDGFLRDGCREIATREARAAHEGHRAEDRLMTIINMYIRGDLDQALPALSEINARAILGTPHIQRARVFTIWMLLHVLVRLPRRPLIAALFEWRWQSGRNIGAQKPLAGLGDALRRWRRGATAGEIYYL